MADILKKEVNLLPALMQDVENKIAVIRGVEVIADADVAALYGVETREVNQAVKNNTDKFPPHYMFELSHSELRDLKSKILISKVSNNNWSETESSLEINFIIGKIKHTVKRVKREK